jgi:ABC-type nickel/cobalt efflux system permease component RcnA
MTKRALVAVLLAVVLTLTGQFALAEQRSPLGVGPGAAPAAERGLLAGRGTTQPQATESGWTSRAYAWLMAEQARINRELTGAVRAIKTGDPLHATLLLAFLSFTYGVLHAAGPGHGKAVISSYVLANERTMRRGILLSFLAALFQAISAILIVAVLTILLKATSLTLRTTEAWIETASWGLVALIGVWLMWRQFAALGGGSAIAPASAHAGAGHAHAHAHDHHHEHACCGCTPEAGGTQHAHDHHHRHEHADGRDHASPAQIALGHHHDHAHHHHADAGDDHAACCGHAHIPAPEALQGEWSWKRALAIALAVGIRPCTGAILVLVFALSQGLLWAGVFATFAMALGTAITISALAAFAVGSREMAMRMAAGGGGKWASRVGTAAGFLGAGLVLGLGAIFFVGSLTNAQSPF